MAYFDSAKNAAMWEKEMVGLRAERARREQEGYKPKPEQATAEAKESKAARKEDPRHRPITLKELEKIEAQMSGVRRVKRPTRERARTMEMRQAEKSSAAPQRKLGN